MPVSSCCQPVGDGELHIHSQSLHSMSDSVWGKLAACPAQFAKGNQWLHGLECGCAMLGELLYALQTKMNKTQL